MPETKKPMHPLNLPPTGNPGNGDSIKPKVFGKGGMGFWEGREKLFFRKVFPPFPNLPLLLPHQPRYLLPQDAGGGLGKPPASFAIRKRLI